MTWRQRRATTDDLDELMALELAIYPDDPWSTEIMGAELANPHGHYLVVVEDEGDTIVGYAGLLAPIGTGQGDIQTVTVAPEARRRGAEELFLEVRHDNEAAQALYAELGFETIGVRKRYYKGGVDALSMRLMIPPARTGTA